MSIEDNKRQIQRFSDEVWNRGNLDAVDETYAADFTLHSAPPGLPATRDGLRMMITGFRAAFTDIVSTVDELIGEGDTVAWRWTFRGTHTGELMGIPASGARVVFAGISIDHFMNGRSVERRDFADMSALMQQLGAPSPATQTASTDAQHRDVKS